MRLPLITVLALSILAACSSGETQSAQAKAPSYDSAPRHAQSGLPVIPLTVASSNGKHTFRVELARTEQDQAKGLMFRTAMGKDEGMIFPMVPPRTASFWMRNTVIPLDLIFVGQDHRILNIAANAVPYDETPLFSSGVSIAVLELNGGRAAQLGIKAGDKVEW